MTLRERAEAHLRNIDTQLAQVRQQQAQHTQAAAQLAAQAEELQQHRDGWAESLKAETTAENTDGEQNG